MSDGSVEKRNWQKGVSGKEIALEARDQHGERLFSPSAARNRDVIADIFQSLMPTQGRILEIGGGTGEHGVHIASKLPDVQWWSGDPDPTSRASINAWIATSTLNNMLPAHDIDVTRDHWGDVETYGFEGVVSINMIHIAPFAAAEGLFAGAGRLLTESGALFLYGPFQRDGQHTAPSNSAFDESLKSRDPRWGVRDLEQELVPLGQQYGLILSDVVSMPANNFSVKFSRQPV